MTGYGGLNVIPKGSTLYKLAMSYLRKPSIAETLSVEDVFINRKTI